MSGQAPQEETVPATAGALLEHVESLPTDHAVAVMDPCRSLTRAKGKPEVWAAPWPRVVGPDGTIGTCTVGRLRDALSGLSPDAPVPIEDPCGDRWGVALVTGWTERTTHGVEGYVDSLGRHRQRACVKPVLVLTTTELEPPRWVE